MSEDHPKHDRDCANKVDRAIHSAKQEGVDFEKIILPIFKDIFCCNYRPHKKLVKQNSIKSAKHFYAFIEVTPFTTEAGLNFRRNVEYNNTTHVMYQLNNRSYSLEVKPHLTIEERVERGFNIIPSKSIPHYKPSLPNAPCENITPFGVFNNDNERQDILNDYIRIEQDMAIEQGAYQEWCMWTSPTFV